MKKAIALILVFALLAVGLVGCAGEKAENNDAGIGNETSNGSNNESSGETNGDAESGSTESLSGVVNTDGSTSMADVVAVLREAFNEQNPDVVINYSGTGSGAGIEAVMAGNVDIGLSSRALTDEEKAAGAVENIVALDGVAVIVNPENPVTDLTQEQIAQIFTGEITNWSELGGEDLEIAVYGREAGSGTRGAFEEILDIEDACDYTNEYGSTGDVIGGVAGNANAIGYASLSAVDDTVKAVNVGGVECSESTVKDGSYAIQRPFVMVTMEGVALSEQAQAFLEFALSEEVAEYIAIAGAVAP